MNAFLNVYSTQALTLNKETGTWVCEASDLRSFGLKRIWHDACDEGCIFRSHRTGKDTVFTLEGIDDGGEGEVAGWRLVSYKLDPPMKILVIND